MGKTRRTGDLVTDNNLYVNPTDDSFHVGTGITMYGGSVGIISCTGLYIGGSSVSAGGGSIGIQSGGTSITSEASTINFVGTGITMADDGSVTDITIPTMSRTATRVVATDAQTAFTVAAYDSPLIDVYLNGVKLDSTEYATTNSTTITLTTGASTGDIFESVSYSNFTGVNVTSANSATTATTSTNVTVADESSDTSCFPLFVTAATGDLPPKSGSNLTFNSSTGILGATTFQGNLDLAGLLKEGVNITAGKLSANTNIDLANGMVHLFTTTETATSTPNIRVDGSTSLDSSMNTGESVTVVLISAAAAAGYSAQLTIDGSAVTEEWLGGSAPSTGGSGGYDVYTYNIIKTGSATFVVLANLVNFA